MIMFISLVAPVPNEKYKQIIFSIFVYSWQRNTTWWLFPLYWRETTTTGRSWQTQLVSRVNFAVEPHLYHLNHF